MFIAEQNWTGLVNGNNSGCVCSKMVDGNGLLSNGQDSLVQPLLTDLYQLTMCYGYWKAKRHQEHAVFDLFFRKNPFDGEFTIFAGLEDCLRFLEHFRYTDSDIAYLRSILPPSTDAEFFEYLKTVDGRNVKLRAIPEGTVVFPRVPLITVSGPLAICQLLETILLNLVNYASLVATNAARFRLIAGPKKSLLEFGLRRAQGPNGALSASKYCYIGGCDATSNILAGKLFGIPVRGTQAHSFVCAFSTSDDLTVRSLQPADATRKPVDFYELAVAKLKHLFENDGKDQIEWGTLETEVKDGEFVAFCAYAIAFPSGFLALVDTYDVLRSGMINFFAVALALHDLGYRPVGVRIDSGDLAYLSKEIRIRMHNVAKRYNLEWIGHLTIVASNDINEDTIRALNEQQHSIDSFGIGTHLVTCQKQPALGCVFKLVSVGDKPRIKLSQEVGKITLPGTKAAYRLYGKTGQGILDLLTLEDEPAPKANEQILCRHPFQETKRAFVVPARVEELQLAYWDDGRIQCQLPTLSQVKDSVADSLAKLRVDHKRSVNPTPYKVSLSEKLYSFLHDLWLDNAPVGQLQ